MYSWLDKTVVQEHSKWMQKQSTRENLMSGCQIISPEVERVQLFWNALCNKYREKLSPVFFSIPKINFVCKIEILEYARASSIWCYLRKTSKFSAPKRVSVSELIVSTDGALNDFSACRVPIYLHQLEFMPSLHSKGWWQCCM